MTEKKELKIRAINPETVVMIDRKASELSIALNRKVSREEYLRLVIENEESKTRYELENKLINQLIDRFSKIMEQQMETFERYIESNEILIELLSGVEREKENDQQTYHF